MFNPVYPFLESIRAPKAYVSLRLLKRSGYAASLSVLLDLESPVKRCGLRLCGPAQDAMFTPPGCAAMSREVGYGPMDLKLLNNMCNCSHRNIKLPGDGLIAFNMILHATGSVGFLCSVKAKGIRTRKPPPFQVFLHLLPALITDHMSSANIIVQGDSCLTSSDNWSITIANRKGLRADP
ncbi:hypothetical protein QTP86_002323 [Hemibagrus guttatus]|nr:hypothetical protein QTP86_002323 [Hemibagrus guttatus]